MVSPNEAALRRCRRAVIFPFLPTAGCFLFSPFFLPPAGYFLSLAKESNQRTPFKERGISISPRTRRARSAYDFCKAKIGFLTERERNPWWVSFTLSSFPMAFGLYDPSPLGTSPLGFQAIIKSRLCREAAKVGSGLWPLGEIKRKTDSHASDVGHWLGMTGFFDSLTSLAEGGEGCSAPAGAGNGFPRQ